MAVTINGATGITQPADNLVGSSSGTVTVQPAAAAGTWTMTLPTTAGTNGYVLGTDGTGVTNWVATAGALPTPTTAGNVIFTTNGTTWSSTQKIVQGTSVASTSGTSITFTGLPAWAKRITMMLNGVSTNGTSTVQIQLGTSGGFVTSGYSSNYGFINSSGFAVSQAALTTGLYVVQYSVNTDTASAVISINNFSGNIWVHSGTGVRAGNVGTFYYSGAPQSLSGTLTQIRLTTVNGTDTFDAGSVNILYE